MRISGARVSASSSRTMRADEVSTLKLESQKLQARAFDGSTQPHCKHVFVTGDFCAADASTPVRSDVWRITLRTKTQAEIAAEKTRKQHHFWGKMDFEEVMKTDAAGDQGNTMERLRFDLLREQVAAEGHAAIQSHSCEVGAAAEFTLGPGANLGSDAPGHRLKGVQHAEVNADGANLAAILRAIGAKAQKLDHAAEIVSRRRRS